jgi:hypothetical protein
MTTSLFVRTMIIFTALQIVMVVVGHFVPPVRSYFAVGGTGLSFVQGGVFAWFSRDRWIPVLANSALGAGISAYLGIVVCFLLGDVPAAILAYGTLGSVFAGLIGGASCKLAARYIPAA